MVYIAVALAWFRGGDGICPLAWDVAGVAVSLAGMALIAFQPRCGLTAASRGRRIGQARVTQAQVFQDRALRRRPADALF